MRTGGLRTREGKRREGKEGKEEDSGMIGCGDTLRRKERGIRGMLLSRVSVLC